MGFLVYSVLLTGNIDIASETIFVVNFEKRCFQDTCTRAYYIFIRRRTSLSYEACGNGICRTDTMIGKQPVLVIIYVFTSIKNIYTDLAENLQKIRK